MKGPKGSAAMHDEYGTKSVFTPLLDHIVFSFPELDRKKLAVRCTRQRGGPTVSPDDGEAAEVIAMVNSCGDGSIGVLKGHYDTLVGDHIQFDVIHVETHGTVSIPRVLYTWQHHPFPGCCRFGINRWVAQPDNTWDSKLHEIAMRARRAVAKRYSCTTLFVVKGPSYHGCEEYDKLPEVFSDNSRTMFAVPTELQAVVDDA